MKAMKLGFSFKVTKNKYGKRDLLLVACLMFQHI